jgi:hypothetical protein
MPFNVVPTPHIYISTCISYIFPTLPTLQVISLTDNTQIRILTLRLNIALLCKRVGDRFPNDDFLGEVLHKGQAEFQSCYRAWIGNGAKDL